jgi:hypothetical protein
VGSGKKSPGKAAPAIAPASKQLVPVVVRRGPDGKWVAEEGVA